MLGKKRYVQEGGSGGEEKLRQWQRTLEARETVVINIIDSQEWGGEVKRAVKAQRRKGWRSPGGAGCGGRSDRLEIQRRGKKWETARQNVKKDGEITALGVRLGYKWKIKGCQIDLRETGGFENGKWNEEREVDFT